MKNKMNLIVALGLISGFVLTGCSSAKEKLGLNNKAPDEFKVLKRAPLAIPPDYALRPPRPGTPRPQEQEAARQAAETVFGRLPQAQTQTQPPSNSAALLLKKAGVDHADPTVRQTLNQETKNLSASNKTVVQKVLDLGGGDDSGSASLVDAPKEAKRLKDNATAGKSPTTGQTPIIIK